MLTLPPIFHAYGEAPGQQEQKVSEANKPKDSEAEPFIQGIYNPNSPITKTAGVKVVYPNKDWLVPSKDDAIKLVNYWVSYYGGNTVLADCLVSHESGFYSLGDNPTSTAAGLWQIIKSTWESTTKAMGVDWTYNEYVYNAEKNAQVGAYLLTHGGYRHWVVFPKCIK